MDPQFADQLDAPIESTIFSLSLAAPGWLVLVPHAYVPQGIDAAFADQRVDHVARAPT